MDTPKGKFTTGSTMRHVVQMTMAGSIGMIFLFLVDVAALFWVSKLGSVPNMAALGFAWTIQFMAVSIAIGLMIATTAMVAFSLGAGKVDEARRQIASAMVLVTASHTVVAAVVIFFRYEILRATGAEGEALEIAARFLLISLPSLPLIALAMACASILRAMGEALKSMYVTLSAGVLAVVLDPILIIVAGLGVDGAAIVISISRMFSVAVGLYLIIKVHDMVARPSLTHMRGFMAPFLMIAAPAILTQLSTPFGNYVVTLFISEFGDSAVAGWAVVGRIMILAFGGIYALSGAIGGIIGQNFGAGLPDRIASAYRDSISFCVLYVLAIWAVLFISSDWIVGLFALTGDGAEVTLAFLRYIAGSFVFVGALFVANSAFNNLGKPLWSTGFNWLRDGILIAPLAMLFADRFAATGVLYAQAVAGAIAGCIAFWVGWRYINNLRTAPKPAPAE